MGVEFEMDDAALSGSMPRLDSRVVPPGQNRIELSFPSFRVRSPLSGHPDVGSIQIKYQAGISIIDQESLEFYLAAFRDVTAYAEDVVNRIFLDLNQLANPEWLEVVGKFSSDGDIDLTIKVNSDDNDSATTEIES